MNFKKGFFAITLLLLSLGFVGNAFADGLRASPFRIEETVKPGQTITSFITITNLSDSSNTFYGAVRDFVPRGEGGEARLVFDDSIDSENSLSSWVSLPNERVTMGPGERRDIPIVFDVPEEAAPGGYYGAIVFGPDAPQVEEGEGAIVTLAKQVGVLALFQVEGEVDEEARIREFFTDRRFYNTPFRISFTTRIENMGNVHIKPIGSIRITDMFGSEVINKRVNPHGGNVLPETVRRFENVWEDNFGFGRHEASLTLSFGTPPDQGGSGIQTMVVKTSFWIIPVRLTLIIVSVLLGLSVLMIFFFRKQKRKAVEEAIRKAGGDPETAKEKDSSKKIFTFIIIIILVLVLMITGTVLFLLFG